jgi:hypothetical protein
MNRVDFNFEVKKVKGTNNYNYITQMHFQNPDMTNIANAEPQNDSFAPDQVLNDGEHIVGIYGVKDRDSAVTCIGFIVWKVDQ